METLNLSFAWRKNHVLGSKARTQLWFAFLVVFLITMKFQSLTVMTLLKTKRWMLKKLSRLKRSMIDIRRRAHRIFPNGEECLSIEATEWYTNSSIDIEHASLLYRFSSSLDYLQMSPNGAKPQWEPQEADDEREREREKKDDLARLAQPWLEIESVTGILSLLGRSIARIDRSSGRSLRSILSSHECLQSLCCVTSSDRPNWGKNVALERVTVHYGWMREKHR